MNREEAALWLTGFFLPPLKGYGENLRAESADKFLKALLALTAAPAAEELANAHGIAQACERRAEAAEAKMDRLAGAVEDVINGITLLDDYRNALTAALAGEK